MRQMMGGSKTGSIEEAVKGFSNPNFLILIASEADTFVSKVEELERRFPKIPSIACVGEGYFGTQVIEKGVIVIGFEGVTAKANLLTDISTMPVEHIKYVEDDVRAVGGNSSNTVCMDLCSSNDECVLATLNSVLRKNNLSLTGGTAWGQVAANGVACDDACAYAIVKNNGGKIKVYKENLYVPTDIKHIVTKADPAKNLLMELDGKPAAEVYKDELHITGVNVAEQTFVNPFGRRVGDDVYIVSLKEMIDGKYFSCYRKVNQMDVLNILQIDDHEKIVAQTISNIKRDFSKVSGIFSINCLFRYLYFQQHNFVDIYFKNMSQLGNHAGMIGLGEHYNTQHTNQTFSCVVFE